MRFHVASTERSCAFRKSVLSLASAATDDPGDHWASLLDRVEVGAVWWEEEQSCACRSDGLAHGLAFVATQIIHDDDVAGCERGHKELLDIGEEELTVNRFVKDAWCVDPVVTQRGKEGQCAPFAKRCLGVQPLATSATAMGAGHVGFGRLPIK